MDAIHELKILSDKTPALGRQTLIKQQRPTSEIQARTAKHHLNVDTNGLKGSSGVFIGVLCIIDLLFR